MNIILLASTLFSTSLAYPHTQDQQVEQRSNLHVQSIFKLSGDFAANEINKQNGYSCCTYKYVVKDLINPISTITGTVESQHMTLHLGKSFCTNNELNKHRTVDSCPLQPGLSITTCDVTVSIHNGQRLSMDHYTCNGGDMATASPVVG